MLKVAAPLPADVVIAPPTAKLKTYPQLHQYRPHLNL